MSMTAIDEPVLAGMTPVEDTTQPTAPDVTAPFIQQLYSTPDQTAAVQPFDFYASGKLERLGLTAQRGFQARMAQAMQQNTVTYAKQGEQGVIDQLQSNIDNGIPVDAGLLAHYQDRIQLPDFQTAKSGKTTQGDTAKPIEPVSPPVEPTAPQPQPDVQFSSSNTTGDADRALAELSLSVASSGLNAVKGITDLNNSIPVPQFIKNIREKIAAATGMDKLPNKLDSLISEVGMYRGQIKDEIAKESGGGGVGIAATVASDIADSAAVTALTLASLGASGFVGKGATIRSAIAEAAKFGGFTYATTPGTPEEKLKAAAHSAAFMLTPIPASKMPKDWMAKVVNIAENIGLNTPAYLDAVKQAKANAVAKGTPDAWVSELVSAATPILVNDVIFGLAVRSGKISMGKDNKTYVKELIANAPKEFFNPVTKAARTGKGMVKLGMPAEPTDIPGMVKSPIEPLAKQPDITIPQTFKDPSTITDPVERNQAATAVNDYLLNQMTGYEPDVATASKIIGALPASERVRIANSSPTDQALELSRLNQKPKAVDVNAEIQPPSVNLPIGNPLKHQNKIQKKLSSIKNKLGIQTVVVNDISGIPADVQQSMQPGDKGVYVKDETTGQKTVYIVSGNHASANEAVATYYHEVAGHGGLRAVVDGNVGKMNDILNSISKGGDKERQAQMADIAGQYGYDMTTKQGRIDAAEEFFAAKVEQGRTDPTLWAKIKTQIRMYFIGKGVNMSDADIDVLINRVYDASMTSKKGKPNAIQEPSTTPPDVRLAPKNRVPVVEGVPESGQTAGTRQVAGEPVTAGTGKAPEVAPTGQGMTPLDAQGQPIVAPEAQVAAPAPIETGKAVPDVVLPVEMAKEPPPSPGKAAELMTPEEWSQERRNEIIAGSEALAKKHEGRSDDVLLPQIERMRKATGTQEISSRVHRHNIEFALGENSPVSAAAVDAYKIKLPDGYVKEGDRYVFKGEPVPTPTKIAEVKWPQEEYAVVSKDYFIAKPNEKDPNESTWQKVKGKKVTVPGFEGFDLFAHKEKSGWSITDAITGHSLERRSPTIKDAIKSVVSISQKKGITSEKLMEIQDGVIKTYGFSPRYAKPTEPVALVSEPLAAKGDTDITAVGSKIPKAVQTKKGGFISVLPSNERIADIGKTIVDWAKLRLTPGKGQSAELNAIEVAAHNRSNMFDIHQKIVKNRVATAVKDLTKTMDETAVNRSVMDVLNGTKSVDQFKSDFGLSDTHAVVQELKWVLNDRSQMSEAIAKQLDLQGKKDIAAIVRQNKGDYLTRFYMKHILGSSFVPDPVDFQAAVDAVKVDLGTQVKKLGKRASTLGRIMVKTGGADSLVNTQRFMETGDTTLVSHLTERQQDFARLLRNRYMGIQDLIEGVTVDPAAVRKGKLIELQQKTDALESAARNTIDYMLGNEPTGTSKGNSPIDISHLTQRVLTPVFRKLFQEVDTPIEVAQKTAEVQGHMLVGLETLNNITHQGAGKWWTKSAPNKELGLTVRLEGKRFGMLDGAFVSKATSELLGKQATTASEVGRMYENLVHYQRTIQVATSFPTTERNLLSGYASFAVASGDAMRPGFHKNMATAAGFVARLAKAKQGTAEYTKLLAELENLAKIGVFHVSETSTSADIMTKESNFGKSPNLLDRFFSPLGNLQNKVGKAYAYGDFLTKYASYLTQKGMGKTDAQATEHVQKFYQHPSSLPTGLRWFSKLPLADYPTYIFDSIRIKKNEIIHAAESAAKGDLVPLLGFALSNGIYALATGETSWVNDKLSEKMKQKIAALPDEQLRAMKAFQPDYWQNTPMFARNGKDDKGNPVIDYVVTGNTMAFPLDDVIMGAIQNRSFGSFLNGSYQLLGKTGMTVNSLAKLFVGQEVGAGASYYKTKGLIDVARSDSDHKVAETFGMVAKAAIELALPVPRRVQKSFQRWKGLDEKLAAGKITQADANEQKADILMSEVLPIKVRTVTRDVAHDMMANTLKPTNDTILELDGKVGRGVEKNATATQIQDSKNAEADLRNKYTEVIAKVKLSIVAFKGVSSVDDIKRTIVDIFGMTKGGLILQGRLDDLMKLSKVPSSARKAYEKGRNEP